MSPKISNRYRRIAASFARPSHVLLSAAILMLLLASPVAWARHPNRTVMAADGKAIRSVFIYTDSLTAADIAATELQQNTCLSVVSEPSQADAILQLGIALPTITQGGGPNPSNISKSRKKKHHRSSSDQGVSVSCSDGDSSSDCFGSEEGAIGPEQDARWMGNIGGNVDVTLVSAVSESDELWAPDPRQKESWSDQLRVAVGCPVCPGRSFHPRKSLHYREWMQSNCSGVLKGTQSAP